MRSSGRLDTVLSTYCLYRMHVLCVRSYFKRILDTTSRFKYIEYAYDSMRRWMKTGTEKESQLKRYIHRHLKLPPTLHESTSREDAEEILAEFAFQYVSALLKYCSDELKEGTWVPFLIAPS